MEKKDVNIEYGKILKKYRKQNHLTQEQVAGISGLAPRYISQIERGELKGSINTLLLFCKVYKITPNDVLIDSLSFNSIPDKDTYDYKISKLSVRDKEIVDELLNFLLNN